jgi:ATP-binding cassette subfamily B protein
VCSSDLAVELEARDVVYRHHGRGGAVLRGATLVLAAGDRATLEGPSGSGKSTLAAVIAGLRAPEAGLLLVRGLDPPTLGAEGLRRCVAVAPQFHDNHVFAGSLAFNLLMGRRWPAARADLGEALQVCQELGLDVIARMPNGLFQQLGETGWQLSHGERSRVFIARALLQGSAVVIFDESLGALDAERHAQALRCIEARAATLVLIAHP